MSQIVPRTKRAIGDVNRNGLKLIDQTGEKACNHPYATVWVTKCIKCLTLQEVNSCEFHHALKECSCK